jgi:hypothetical protein
MSPTRWPASGSMVAARSSQYEPEVGRSRQPITFMNVDFPEPDGPITATISPGIAPGDRAPHSDGALVPGRPAFASRPDCGRLLGTSGRE